MKKVATSIKVTLVVLVLGLLSIQAQRNGYLDNLSFKSWSSSTKKKVAAKQPKLTTKQKTTSAKAVDASLPVSNLSKKDFGAGDALTCGNIRIEKDGNNVKISNDNDKEAVVYYTIVDGTNNTTGNLMVDANTSVDFHTQVPANGKITFDMGSDNIQDSTVATGDYCVVKTGTKTIQVGEHVDTIQVYENKVYDARNLDWFVFKERQKLQDRNGNLVEYSDKGVSLPDLETIAEETNLKFDFKAGGIGYTDAIVWFKIENGLPTAPHVLAGGLTYESTFSTTLPGTVPAGTKMGFVLVGDVPANNPLVQHPDAQLRFEGTRLQYSTNNGTTWNSIPDRQLVYSIKEWNQNQHEGVIAGISDHPTKDGEKVLTVVFEDIAGGYGDLDYEDVHCTVYMQGVTKLKTKVTPIMKDVPVYTEIPCGDCSVTIEANDNGTDCGDPQTVNLMAGQHIDAGSVTVRNNKDSVYVTYTTEGDWYLKHVHLYAGDENSIPSTPNGNPKIGRFTYNEATGNVQSYTIAIPLTSVESCFALAAHAEVVKRGDEGDIIQSETAWGEGEQITAGGSWAMKFSYCEQTCNGTDPDTGCPDGFTRYAVSNGSPDNNNWHVWMPSLFIDGQTARMTFEKEAYLDIKNDGSIAHLYGYAIVTGSGGSSTGARYLVDASFNKAGDQMGPKITLPEQTPEITDKWKYFEMDGTKSTISLVGGNQVFKLTHMPANGQFGLQVGISASGQNLKFGAAAWFFWEEVGTGRKGTGDFIVDMDSLCPATCPDDATRYALSNGSPDNNNWHVWMPSLFIDGQTARMTFEKEAYMDIKKDGSGAHLYGYAIVTGSGGSSMGARYLVDATFNKAGDQMGPKITLPEQTPEITDKWKYFEMDGTKSTISLVGGNQVFNLTHMPANGQFGLQVGISASGQNMKFGAAAWFFWEEAGTGRKGTGDFIVDMENLCPDTPPAPVCEILVNGKPVDNSTNIWNGKDDKVTVTVANITEPVTYNWKLTFPTDPSVPAVEKSGTFTQDGTYEITIPIPAKGQWGNVSADGSGMFKANVDLELNTPCGNQSWEHVYYAPNEADVKVVKTVDKHCARVGDTLTYSIVVTNNGPRTAKGVKLTDRLPYGLDLVSVTGGTFTNGVMYLGTLGVNESKTITVVTIAGRTCIIKNVACVSSVSPTDPDLTNNMSCARVFVLPARKADLKIIPRTCPRTVTQGQTATYYFTVINRGPNTAENISITEGIPTGATLVSSTAGSIKRLRRGDYATFQVKLLMKKVGTHRISASVSSTTQDPYLWNNKTITAVRVRPNHCPTDGGAFTSPANVRVLPNPVRTYVGVDLRQLYKAASRQRIRIQGISIQVADMNGNMVINKRLPYRKSRAYFSMRYKRRGLYALKCIVTYRENGRTKRAIVQKRIIKK